MFETILGVLLIIMSLFLIVAVLMQHGKSHGLSGTIAGGAETLFGKSKGSDIDSKLSKVTTVVSIVFVLVVIVAYIAQGGTGNVIEGGGTINSVDNETTAATDETTAATDETTAATNETTAADVTDGAEVTE